MDAKTEALLNEQVNQMGQYLAALAKEHAKLQAILQGADIKEEVRSAAERR
jgi:hypothetical protein